MLSALIASCQPAKPEGVSDLTVRLPAAPGAPGVAYFTVTAGKQDRTLIAVTSPHVLRTEMHETSTVDGKSTMRKIEGGVDIKAGQSVAFKSGGKHVMLFDVNPRVKSGDMISINFAFADGQPVQTQVKASPPGAASDAHAH